MRLQHFVWSFPEALDSETCNRIIELGLSKKKRKATVQNKQEQYRESNVVWLDDRWITELLIPYIYTANESAGWNFQWDPVDSIQFTEYNKGGYYDWHRDSFEQPDDAGKIRKISVTINLNDDFKGGDMWFDNALEYNKTDPKKISKSTGGITVFPSHVWHKVDKVTKGTRYSLVFWFKGNPFV